MWIRVCRRAALLVVLGWAINNSIAFTNWYHSDNPSARYGISLGMDVLQLLGVGYLVTRIGYELGWARRLGLVVGLYLWHWSILRWVPQGVIPAGTFTEKHNAVGYIYSTWRVFRTVDVLGWVHGGLAGRLTLSAVGMLSVAPAAATMLLGTLLGDWLRRPGVGEIRRIKGMVGAGIVCAVIGFLWSFDLPFNKPRWSPGYLMYTSGVGAVLMALLYWLIDVKRSRRWIYPFVVLGANSIAVYWLSIMAKVWLLNTPKVRRVDGSTTNVTGVLLQFLKGHLGRSVGGWMFTFCFVGFWWIVLEQMYRRRIFWKI
jgi:predicted acyltransferase